MNTDDRDKAVISSKDQPAIKSAPDDLSQKIGPAFSETQIDKVFGMLPVKRQLDVDGMSKVVTEAAKRRTRD